MNHIDTILLTIFIITAMFSSIAPLIVILIALTFAFRWALTRIIHRELKSVVAIVV